MDEGLGGGGGLGWSSRLTTCSYGTTLGGRFFYGSVLVAGIPGAWRWYYESDIGGKVCERGKMKREDTTLAVLLAEQPTP